MSKASGLSHIGLRTQDVVRAERFYVDVLDGTALRRREVPDRRVWLEVRGVRLEIAEVGDWPALTETQRSVLPTVSFFVTPEEVDVIVERLKATGVPYREPMLKATGPGVGVYFGDPDGNPLSLSCPEGYERPDLARSVRNTWIAAPFDWQPSTQSV